MLIAGKDARTDALVQACAESPHHPLLFGISEISPPGMLERCSEFLGEVSLTDLPAVLDFARKTGPDLFIIGPEDPLCAGIVDAVEDDLGVPCFGPRRAHARIEGSKSWCRELVARHGIAGNPEHRVFHDERGLEGYLAHLGDYVVKPDGLTGGKGVRVSGHHFSSREEGLGYARSLVREEGIVLIEERLEGEEFSLQSVTDGDAVLHCPPVQDHKRAFESDEGPNTGGMGSYSCADHSLPFLVAEDLAEAKAINERVIAALDEEVGTPYRGVLYGGYMATSDGVRLVEFNARFGDPEAMNVVPLLEADLLELCWATATGTLGALPVSFAARATVCKYVVPEPYPAVGGRGAPITVDPAAFGPDVRLFWSSVNVVPGGLALTGSRALAVVGLGNTLEEAEARAERGAASVGGPVRYRHDIGTAALVERRVAHMRALRGG